MLKKGLLVAAALCLLFSFPAVFAKMSMENSAPAIEFAADYSSLLSLSERAPDPEEEMHRMLGHLKEAGIPTVSLPGNSVYALEHRGLVSLYSAHQWQEKQFFSPHPLPSFGAHSIAVLPDRGASREVAKLLSERFSAHLLETHREKGLLLLAFSLPAAELRFASLPFLPRDLTLLTAPPYSFSLLLKTENRWDGQDGLLVNQIRQMPPSSLSKWYPAEAGGPGFPEETAAFFEQLPRVPFVYKEYFAEADRQEGIDALSAARNHHTVRMHVLDASLFSPEANELPERVVRAAKERNIRVFHVQFPLSMAKVPTEETFSVSLGMLKEAQKALEHGGFSLGIAEPFAAADPWWLLVSRGAALIGAVAAVSLTLVCFSRRLALLPLLGTAASGGAAAFFGFSLNWIWKGWALGFAICLPVLSVLFLLHALEKWPLRRPLFRALLLFASVSFITLLGSCLLIALHAHVSFALYLDQFRGVSLAHLLPPFLAGAALCLYQGRFHFTFLKKTARQPLRLYHLGAALLLVGLCFYYLSRTGNGGVLLPFESEFRLFMETVFGVRPRTKEFLIAHPLLLVILYYWHRVPPVKWLLPVAVIGQLSMINTFTHFHTPVTVSLSRALYGLGIGCLLGLAAIVLLTLSARYASRFFSAAGLPQSPRTSNSSHQ